MKRVLMFLATGFEEIEAITVVDILRRSQIKVDLCSIDSDAYVEGSHGIKVFSDVMLENINIEDYDALVTPGGMPGSTNLRDDNRVIDALKKFYDREDKLIASICASPIVLKAAGISPNIKGTSYPAFRNEVNYANYIKEPVVMDKNVITSMGPATALHFAFRIVAELLGEEYASELEESTLFNFVNPLNHKE